mmetsp:Transcript_41134/g.136300  ORF Transcript_41134/g.136300 Transcript_41134/m.136300 type:complete len:203 (+) Transcript_41134:849-1457(+)
MRRRATSSSRARSSTPSLRSRPFGATRRRSRRRTAGAARASSSSAPSAGRSRTRSTRLGRWRGSARGSTASSPGTRLDTAGSSSRPLPAPRAFACTPPTTRRRCRGGALTSTRRSSLLSTASARPARDGECASTTRRCSAVCRCWCRTTARIHVWLRRSSPSCVGTVSQSLFRVPPSPICRQCSPPPTSRPNSVRLPRPGTG